MEERNVEISGEICATKAHWRSALFLHRCRLCGVHQFGIASQLGKLNALCRSAARRGDSPGVSGVISRESRRLRFCATTISCSSLIVSRLGF